MRCSFHAVILGVAIGPKLEFTESAPIPAAFQQVSGQGMMSVPLADLAF